MTQMVEAVMHPDRFYSQQLIDRVSSQYDINSPELESRLMAVIDYISGMTDGRLSENQRNLIAYRIGDYFFSL